MLTTCFSVCFVQCRLAVVEVKSFARLVIEVSLGVVLQQPIVFPYVGYVMKIHVLKEFSLCIALRLGY